MRALDRKLVRDLWDIKEQALAIALVMACGMGTFLMAVNTLFSLQIAKETYYDHARLADVFASLKRAPATLVERIREIPGVARVETRVVKDVTLDVAGLDEPAVGRILSIPEGREPVMNAVHLRRGRFIEPGRGEEVLVSEGFAKAHGFVPGERLQAVINGKKKELEIVGIALSPEYIFQIRPGDIFPDELRFGILWMGRRQLEAAFDMEGAFNDVNIGLMPMASEKEVIRQLDRLLAPYGGLGAYGRADQVSNRLITDEIKQLWTWAVIAPSIFLSVAAFLLNVILTRIIRTQREQIAALKAFGYDNVDVGVHYVKMVLVVVVVATAIGSVVGYMLGTFLTNMYGTLYRFPNLTFRFGADSIAIASLVSFVAAVAGTLGAVWQAVRLPPAEAMRPEPPASYHATFVERLGLQRFLSTGARMVLRNLGRQPIKSALATLGVAMAISVMIVGSFSADALDYIVDVQFFYAQRQELHVTFVEPRPMQALFELANLPGVIDSEPFRAVPVRLRHRNHERRVGLLGLDSQPRLQRVVNEEIEPVGLPEHGIVLAEKLGRLLDVRVGELVTVEVLEGNRGVHQVPVTLLVAEFIGANAYMNRQALNRLLKEGASISGGYLTADSREVGKLYRQLKNTPGVASVTIRKAAIRSFMDTVAENMLRIRTINICFAGVIAFGVVYNTARIALAERGRELASLRVLGFTRQEISAILLGELAAITLAALPLGVGMGYAFAAFLCWSMDTDLVRIPLVIDNDTSGAAVLVVLVAAAVSGLVVRRKLDELDLVAVLKTRE